MKLYFGQGCFIIVCGFGKILFSKAYITHGGEGCAVMEIRGGQPRECFHSGSECLLCGTVVPKLCETDGKI